jgi:cytoskeletal protein CcmA (bactofilin family)
MKKIIIVILLILLLPVMNSGAVEVIMDKKEPVIVTEVFDEDYIFFGEKFEFKGRANDLFVFCQEINFSGRSNMALFAFAQQVTMAGETGNGIKSAAQIISISGDVKGTSFFAAEEVMIEKSSHIIGDIFSASRTFTVKGKLKGDLHAAAAEIDIQSEIHGNVHVYAGKLTIPENGKIIGNLIYHSDKEITQEEALRVTGEIKFEQEEKDFFDESFCDESHFIPFWLSIIFKISFILFGLLVLAFPVTTFLAKRFGFREIVSNTLWGLVPIFIYPTAILISIVMIITLPVAVTLIFGLIPLILVTKVLGLTLIGSFILTRFKPAARNRFLFFLTAAVIYSILTLIPVLGILLLALVTSTGCGYVLLSLFKKETI